MGQDSAFNWPHQFLRPIVADTHEGMMIATHVDLALGHGSGCSTTTMSEQISNLSHRYPPTDGSDTLVDNAKWIATCLVSGKHRRSLKPQIKFQPRASIAFIEERGPVGRRAFGKQFVR